MKKSLFLLLTLLVTSLSSWAYKVTYSTPGYDSEYDSFMFQIAVSPYSNIVSGNDYTGELYLYAASEKGVTVTVNGESKTLSGSNDLYITLSEDVNVVVTYGTPVAHTHSYSDAWSYDATSHWHACTSTVGTCDAPKANEAAHTFDANNKCTVCNYVKSAGFSPVAGKAYAVKVTSTNYSGKYLTLQHPVSGTSGSSYNGNYREYKRAALQSSPEAIYFTATGDNWYIHTSSDAGDYLGYMTASGDTWNTNVRAFDYTTYATNFVSIVDGNASSFKLKAGQNSSVDKFVGSDAGSDLCYDKSTDATVVTFTLVPLVKVTYNYVTEAGGTPVGTSSVYLQSGASYPAVSVPDDYEYVSGLPTGTVTDAEAAGDDMTKEILVKAHVHTYAETWSYDDNYHWHAATCGHDVKSDYAAHTWEGGVCSVCGFAHPADGSAEYPYTWDAGTGTKNLAGATWDWSVAKWYKIHLPKGLYKFEGNNQIASSYYGYYSCLWNTNSPKEKVATASGSGYIYSFVADVEEGDYLYEAYSYYGGTVTVTEVTRDGSSFELALPITVGTNNLSNKSYFDDTYYYSVELENGTYEFKPSAAYNFYIYNSSKNQVAQYNDENTPVYYTATAGKYYVKVTYANANQTLTITKCVDAKMQVTAAKVATFVAPFAVTLPTGVEAFTAEVVEDSWVKLTSVATEGQTLTAGTAVVLKSEAEVASTTFTDVPTVTETSVTTGCLTGNLGTVAATVGTGHYLLQNRENGIGWYKTVAENTIGVNRCYLTKPQNARATFFPMVEGTTTGISNIAAEAQSKKDGKYLVNGKFVIVKSGKAYNANGVQY